MKIIQILSLLFLFNSLVYAQSDANIKTIDDYNLSEANTELQFLNVPLKDVKVLALGESTHGTREFNLMYLKVFKYLIEDHGFNTLFIEDEYSRCLILDNYVKCDSECGVVSSKVLNNWPWRTDEMNNLIEWIKNYNRINKNEMISIVGIDIQDSEHIFSSLNEILIKSKQDTISLSSPKKTVKGRRTERKHVNRIKKYSDSNIISLFEAKAKYVEISSRTIYKNLLDNLEWNRKKYKNPKLSIRDLAMGKNVISYLDENPKSKGMLIAHNSHIVNLIIEKRNERKNVYFAGGVIKKKLGDKYFAIMQDFDEGCFNAYSLVSKKLTPVTNNLNDYQLGEVCVEKSIDNSIGAILRNTDGKILYILENELFNLGAQEELRYHDIGGLFIPLKENPNQAKQFFFLEQANWYDAYILHKVSTPTSMID